MPAPSHLLKQRFSFDPTEGQLKLFDLMDDLLNPDHASEILILRGYAGTGKTSLIFALVQVLPLFNFNFVLIFIIFFRLSHSHALGENDSY